MIIYEFPHPCHLFLNKSNSHNIKIDGLAIINAH